MKSLSAYLVIAALANAYSLALPVRPTNYDSWKLTIKNKVLLHDHGSRSDTTLLLDTLHVAESDTIKFTYYSDHGDGKTVTLRARPLQTMPGIRRLSAARAVDAPAARHGDTGLRCSGWLRRRSPTRSPTCAAR